MSKRWETIFHHLQQDLKLFLFLMGLLCFFRVAFIVVMNSYLSEASNWADIGKALYYGTRMSLKSAGPAMGISLIISLSVQLLCGRRWAEKARLWWGGLCCTVLTFLFYARIPYYKQFHMAFNEFIFNTFRDDTEALFWTIVEQYQLPLRLLLVALTAAAVIWLLRRVLMLPTWQSPQFGHWTKNMAFRIGCVWLVWFLLQVTRFAGSLTYAHDISWENSALTHDQLLNEAILDDVQALQRAYELHERLRVSTGLEYDPQQLADYGAYLTGKKLQTNNLEDYMRQEAAGAKVPKPRHVFLIIAESYANWPLLPAYADLHVADGMKTLTQESNAVYVPTFLPNGMATISAVNGIVSGLAEANMYPNYQPETYRGAYATAIAPQMKRLGYKTSFWYGGPSSWERVKDFSLAQGFDAFHAYGDLQQAPQQTNSKNGNIWGCDDKDLFAAVQDQFTPEEQTFQVILTVSNHAPYTVDLAAAGFEAEKVRAALPDSLKDDAELMKQLGHFWYADKLLSQFIRKMYQKYPDSLFLMVGDHGDRFNIEKQPKLYERYGVPFIVFGQGVNKDIFPGRVAGSHINITPTLIELIAPAGFSYYGTGKSLTKGNAFGFNYGFWITPDWAGRIGSDQMQYLPWADEGTPRISGELMQTEIDAVRAVSWWRIQNGKTIPQP